LIIKDKDEALSYIEDFTLEEQRFIVQQLSFFLPNYMFLPSYRAGITDGKKRYFKIHEDKIVIPKGLIPLLIKAFEQSDIKYYYQKTQYNDKIPTIEEFNSFVESLNLPFKPYDYQLKASYESICNYRQVNLMCTSSGKSLTVFIIIRWFLLNNLKGILVVPTVMLTTQMFNDFKDYGWVEAENYVHLIGGDNKIKITKLPILISTWQSLYTSPKLFSDLDYVMVDECHTASSSSFEDIIFKASVGARYRLGFTGTLPREATDKITILASLGAETRYITTRQLIDRGLATPVVIKALFLKYQPDECKLVKLMKYTEEVKYITMHHKRTQVLSKVINKITNDTGNSIVLFDQKEHGKSLCLSTFKAKFGYDIDIKELMKADNTYGIYYVIGDSKAKVREDIRQLLENNNNCILFGTSSILSTGINIKNLHNLFLTAGGKSSIKINQGIGRLLRKHASKNTVSIWDMVDDLCIKNKSTVSKNYYYKHFEERIMLYQENEYEIIEKVLQL
jgi:superfamily II DNA or RNA helicase